MSFFYSRNERRGFGMTIATRLRRRCGKTNSREASQTSRISYRQNSILPFDEEESAAVLLASHQTGDTDSANRLTGSVSVHTCILTSVCKDVILHS